MTFENSVLILQQIIETLNRSRYHL